MGSGKESSSHVEVVERVQMRVIVLRNGLEEGVGPVDVRERAADVHRLDPCGHQACSDGAVHRPIEVLDEPAHHVDGHAKFGVVRVVRGEGGDSGGGLGRALGGGARCAEWKLFIPSRLIKNISG